MLNKKCTILARHAIASVTLFFLATLASFSYAAQSPGSYMTAMRYNLSRQVTAVINPSADGNPIYPAVRNTYNGKGLLISIERGVLTAWQNEQIDPADWGSSFNLSHKTIYTYDSLGRKSTESIVGSDDIRVSLTQYNYDDQDRVKCKTVRMNPVTYDSLPDACQMANAGLSGPDRITQYDYKIDKLVNFENRARQTSWEQIYVENRYGNSPNTSGSLYLLIDQLDANKNQTHYEYDTRGRQQRMYFPNKISGSTPGYNASDYEEYGYDLNSNRTTLKKRDGRTITYNYDNLNRVWRKDLPNADNSTTSVYQGYDLLGHLQYSRFGSTSGPGVTNTYNGFGELTSESSDINGISYTVSYKYDMNGNRTRVTYPDGLYFTYRYDQLDRMTDIFEGSNIVPALVHYTYDNLARPESLVTSGNVRSATIYDAASRPQTLSLDPTGTDYDVKHMFAFNPAGQIISRELSNIAYQYKDKGSASGVYSSNGLNQYIQIGNLSFSYDDNGNLKSDGNTTFGYDVENRMITAAGAKNATLDYDPRGRLYQITGISKTNFVYSGDSLIAEYQNGLLTKRYVFGSGVDKPIASYSGATVTSSSRQFLHGNYQGSVIAITDSSGNVVATNKYDAYGVPASTNQGRFAYTGQTYLPEVGMYYYKARIYYPQIGRFLQTDPIGYKDDMDLYTYVANDPLDKTDPRGESIIDLIYVATDVADFASAAASGDIVGMVTAGGMLVLDAQPIPGVSSAAHAAEAAVKVERAASKILTKVEKTASGRRVEDFTRTQKNRAKAANAERNGGKMKCDHCGKELENVKNERGTPTPDNQAQVHHEPPISEGGTRETSKPEVLCPECHRKRHDE